MAVDNLVLTSNLATLTWTGADGTNPTQWSTNPGVLNWSSSGNSSAYAEGSCVTFDDSVGFGSTVVDISAADVLPGSVVFSNSNASYTLQGSHGIAGAASLNVAGGGLLTINNSNSFTGGTTISGGTIQLGNPNGLVNSTVSVGVDLGLIFSPGNTAPTIGGLRGDGYISLSDGTNPVTLTVGGNNESTTYSGGMFDAGGLTKVGSGLLVLAEPNFYGGGTTIGGGTLQVGLGGSISLLGTGTVTNNGALAFSYTGNFIPAASAIGGSGSVVQQGTGVTGIGMPYVNLSSLPNGRDEYALPRQLLRGKHGRRNRRLGLGAGNTAAGQQRAARRRAIHGPRQFAIWPGGRADKYGPDRDLGVRRIRHDDHVSLERNRLELPGCGPAGHEQSGGGRQHVHRLDNGKRRNACLADRKWTFAGYTRHHCRGRDARFGSRQPGRRFAQRQRQRKHVDIQLDYRRRRQQANVRRSNQRIGCAVQNGDRLAQTLSGTDTYTGGTNVNGGKLIFTNAAGILAGSNLYVGDPNLLSLFPAPVVPGLANDLPIAAQSADVQANGTTPPAPVPEPGTVALLATGAAVAAHRWRRRRRDEGSRKRRNDAAIAGRSRQRSG